MIVAKIVREGIEVFALILKGRLTQMNENADTDPHTQKGLMLTAKGQN